MLRRNELPKAWDDWRNLKCILLSLEWVSPIKLEKCETPWAFLRSMLNAALNHGYISSRWSGSNWTTTFFSFFGLYCMACGVVFPQLGIELVLPAMAVQSLHLWTIREVPELPLFLFFFKICSSIYFWLCLVFVAVWGFLIVLCGLLTVVASLVVERRL